MGNINTPLFIVVLPNTIARHPSVTILTRGPILLPHPETVLTPQQLADRKEEKRKSGKWF